tara:strand:- start:203 stop:442 length:240 start_codon:yes stop_codon:yes gene_type:complete
MKKKYKGFKQRDVTGVISVSARSDESAENLVRRFKRKLKKDGMLKEIRAHYLERFKSKSEKKREKKKRAISRMSKSSKR